MEGYGRKIYKAEFMKFLIYSRAYNDETRDHLETLYNTKSLTNQQKYQQLHDRIDLLGMKLKNYYEWVDKYYIPSL